MARAVYDFQSLNQKTAIGKRREARPAEIIQFDDAMFESKLDAMIKTKVEDIVNAMLDAEADEITNAARYERKTGRKAFRAGHYERGLTAKVGRLELKVPKLKGALFESAVMEMYLAGVSTRQVDMTEAEFNAAMRAADAVSEGTGVFLQIGVHSRGW